MPPDPEATTTERGAVPNPLVLVHLSDIHLSEGEITGTQDLDVDIRKKLRADLSTSALPLQNGVDGVLITGDIAYAGKTAEYTSAHDWLKDLCAHIKCPPSHVWVVPGNHDVSWATTSQSILDMHEVIRNTDPPGRLRDRLADTAAANALLEPFVAFNVFARPYESRTQPDAVAWESDELVLNDGSTLRLRGLNSALVSDKRDKALGKPCQVVGEKQVQLSDDDDAVCYLTLCHHPPAWLHDQTSVEDHLNNRARIQLYGHDHRQRARQVDNSLILFAGALHPERGDADWEPRYNIITLTVGSGPPRTLTVELFARVWKSAETRFGPDPAASGQYPSRYVLSLPPWTPMAQPPHPPTVAEPKRDMTDETTNPPPPISHRDIVYDFFEVSYPKRMAILLRLDLLEQQDERISDSHLIRKALQRAQERNRLPDLAAALKEAIARP